MPWTGTSGADQAAGAAAPRIGTSRDKWRAGMHERSNRGGTSRRSRRHPGLDHPGTSGGGRPGLEHPGRNKQPSRRPPDRSIQGQVAEKAPDRIIPGKTGRRRTAGEKGPDAQGKIVPGRTSRRSPHPLDRAGSNTKGHATEEH